MESPERLSKDQEEEIWKLKLAGFSREGLAKYIRDNYLDFSRKHMDTLLRLVDEVVKKGEAGKVEIITFPVVKAVPKKRVRIGEEIFGPPEFEEVGIDLAAFSPEDLERLRKAIDEELRRRGYKL